jgi:hypothetical protein
MLYAVKVRNERVKYVEFRGPVMSAVGMGGVLILYILLFVLALIINKLAFWGFVLALPIMGYFSLLYRDLWEKYKTCSQLKALNTEGPLDASKSLKALQIERMDILNRVRKGITSEV